SPGDWVHEPGGIARQQETVHVLTALVDSQRAEHDWPAGEPRISQPLAEHRVTSNFTLQKRGRPGHRRIARMRWPDQTHVRPAARHRRDADVSPASHVHLAK